MTSTILYLFLAIQYVTACIKMVHPDMEGLSTTDMPVTDAPVTVEPMTNEPVTEEPATEEPATNEPATNEPATDEPITDEPMTQEPVTKEPVTEEPVTEEPITEEPITEEPVTEEPVTEEPVTDAPGDCTTCKPETLFKDSDLTQANYYFPRNDYVLPYTNGGCNEMTIDCNEPGRVRRLKMKGPDGDVFTGPDADDTILVGHIFACTDAGKWYSSEFGDNAESVFCEEVV